MSNSEDTHPPVTPRNLLKRALAKAIAHPEVTVPIGTFVLGVFVGWVLL